MESGKLSESESHLLRLKRAEYIIVMWISAFLFPICIYFAFGFFRKKDGINADAHAIINDALEANVQNALSHETFQLQDIRTHGITSLLPTELNYTLRSNYYFVHIMHTFLFIPRRSRRVKANIKTTSATVSHRYDSALDFHLSIGGNTTTKTRFVIPTLRIQARGADTEAYVTYLSKVHITFVHYASYVGFTTKDLVYTDEKPTSVDVFVHDSSEPLEYGYPELESTGILGFAVIFMFLALFMMLFFIWHSWSVRYTIIESVIKRGGTEWSHKP